MAGYVSEKGVALAPLPVIMRVHFHTGLPARACSTLEGACRGPGEGHIMATVREILARKGPHVYTTGPGATVLEAALLMNEHKIGSLVVIDDGQVVGIFTERDVLR